MRKTKLNISKLSDRKISPERALKRAQMGVLSKEPFIATVMLNLTHVFSEDVPTAATNGLGVKYNPEFFQSLTPSEQVFLIAHESWHVALQHNDSSRLQNRIRLRWNQAADYVINGLLKQQNVGQRPQGGLYEYRFLDMSTEAVYAELEEYQKEGYFPETDLFGDDIQESDSTHPSSSTSLSPEEKMKLDEILVRAKDEALKQKQWGNMAGHVKDLLDDIIRPKHSWKDQLRNFITERTKNDYSWSRPNRRTDPDIYIPSLYSENPRSVVIAVDTSGSISTKELTMFLNEIKAIHEDTRPVETHIIAIDTEIHDTYQFDGWDTIPTALSFGGRGGTAFAPAFKWAKDKDPSCLIYLTDMYASFDFPSPSYPTLWVSTTPEERAPFGDTIYLDVAS